MNHTPGKWIDREGPLNWEIRVENTAVVLADVFLGGSGVAFPVSQAAANARLMASAPELYGALISMVAASSPASRRVARTWADRAIAKANGEAPR